MKKMSGIDKLITEYLKAGEGLKSREKTDVCPDEGALIDYLTQNAASHERIIVEKHIAGCGYCLSQLSLAAEAFAGGDSNKLSRVPRSFVNALRASLRVPNNRRRSIIAKLRARQKGLFLSAAIIFFILSFLIPRYFIQFLVASLILGIRWSFESEGGKTLIMVFDSWRRHSRDEDDEISRRLKRRF